MPLRREIADVQRLLEGVSGWLMPAEVALLYRLARSCTGRGAIVEIGSWKGRSTICLAKGSEAGARVPVHAVDPHTGSSEHDASMGEVDTFAAFERNLEGAGVRELVIPMRMTSEEAAHDFAAPVELLFVDGAHEYELVALDFERWSPKVVAGGVIAFHDAGRSSTGPRRVVEERLVDSGLFSAIGAAGSIVYGRKAGKPSLRRRLRGRVVLFARDVRDYVEWRRRRG